jgi:DNA-binding NarL/FixJ family response regulator
MIKIALVDDEQFDRDSINFYIQHDARDAITIIGTANSVNDLIAKSPEVPHVTVLDFFLKNGTKPKDNIRLLREWGCQVVVVSATGTSPEVNWVSLDAGAHSFVGKDEVFASLREAIEAAASGEPFVSRGMAKFVVAKRLGLTDRQEDVAALLAAGLTQAEVGKRLGIRSDGVKAHVRNIRERYWLAGRPVDDDLPARLRADGFYHGE